MFRPKYRVFIKYCVFILKYFGLLPFSVFPRCQCVCTHQAGRTSALQQNWQSSEKFHFKEDTIINEHPVVNYEYLKSVQDDF